MMKKLVKFILLAFIIKTNLISSANPLIYPAENNAILQAKMILDLNRLLEKNIKNKDSWTFANIIQELKNSPILYDKLTKEDREKYLSLLNQEVKKLKTMYKSPRTFKEWLKTGLFSLGALTPIAAFLGFCKYGHLLINNYNYDPEFLAFILSVSAVVVTTSAIILGINNITRFDLEMALKRLKYIKSLFVIYDRECQLKELATA